MTTQQSNQGQHTAGVLSPQERAVLREQRALRRLAQLEIESEAYTQSHHVFAPSGLEGKGDILVVVHRSSPAWTYQDLRYRHGNFVYLIQISGKGPAEPLPDRQAALRMLGYGGA